MRITRLSAVFITLMMILQYVESPLAAAEEFSYPLFDGKSLAGWTVENGCQASVADGVLKLEAGDGWLRSHYILSGFDLHVEWNALKQEQYDAGIYLRAGSEGSPFPKRGYQINLKQGQEGNIPRLQGATSTGLVLPAGQWNVFDISVRGETVALTINGKPAYRVGGLKTEPGYVGIQVEVPLGGQFELRNIRIAEPGMRSLFNGHNVEGWEAVGGAADDCWTVADGVLTCLQKKGPWLRTQDQFGDFKLRFDYRVEPGANSGIYVRVPADGNHHRDNTSLPPAGFEVQLLDDFAEKHSHLHDYQHSGSVYDLAGPTRQVLRRAGEWNTMEIDCRGQRVAIVHNGVPVVDIDEHRYPLLALRQTSGFLGLQNHGGGVSFRNIRIGQSTAQP